MDTAPVVAVVCDRCHRPGWRLEVGPYSGEVLIDGARIQGHDDESTWAAVLRGPRHRFNADPPAGTRAGAFILPADGPETDFGGRVKLVCIGRKHRPHERVVTRDSARRAYHAAVAAGRASIRLGEI
jgi:hypothetical protein